MSKTGTVRAHAALRIAPDDTFGISDKESAARGLPGGAKLESLSQERSPRGRNHSLPTYVVSKQAGDLCLERGSNDDSGFSQKAKTAVSAGRGMRMLTVSKVALFFWETGSSKESWT